MEFDEQASSRECSLDELLETVGDRLGGSIESFEDAVVDRLEKDMRLRILSEIIPTLSSEERRMLDAIAIGMSSREYEKAYYCYSENLFV